MVVTPASTAEDRTAWHELRQQWRGQGTELPRVTAAANTVTPVLVRATRNERLSLDPPRQGTASPLYQTPARLSWTPAEAKGSTPQGGLLSLEAQRRRELAQVFVQFLTSPDFNLAPAESFKHCAPIAYTPTPLELAGGKLMYHQLINGLAFMRFFDDPVALCSQDVDTAQRIWNAMSTLKDGYVYWDSFVEVLVALFEPLPAVEAAAVGSKNEGVRMKLAHYRAGSGSVSSVSTVPRFPPQAPRNEVSVFDSPAVSSPTSHLAPLHVRSPFDAYATSSVFRAEVGIDSGPESLTMQHRSVSYAEQRSVSAVRHPTPPPPQRLGGGGGGIPAQPTPQTSPKPEEAWLRERNPPGNVTPPLKSAEKPKEEPWYLQSWRSPQKGEQPPPPPPRSASKEKAFSPPIPFSPERFEQIGQIHSQLNSFKKELLTDKWTGSGVGQKESSSSPSKQPLRSSSPYRRDVNIAPPALPSPALASPKGKVEAATSPLPLSPLSPSRYQQMVQMKEQLDMIQEQIAARDSRPSEQPNTTTTSEHPEKREDTSTPLLPRRSVLKSVSIVEDPERHEGRGSNSFEEGYQEYYGNHRLPSRDPRDAVEGESSVGSAVAPQTTKERRASSTVSPARSQHYDTESGFTASSSGFSMAPSGVDQHKYQGQSHTYTPSRRVATSYDSSVQQTVATAEGRGGGGSEGTPEQRKEKEKEYREEEVLTPRSILRSSSRKQSAFEEEGNKSIAIVGKNGIEYISPAKRGAVREDAAEVRLQLEKEAFEKEKREWEQTKAQWDERRSVDPHSSSHKKSERHEDNSGPPPKHLQPQLQPLKEKEKEKENNDKKAIQTPSAPNNESEWRQQFPQDQGWIAHDGVPPPPQSQPTHQHYDRTPADTPASSDRHHHHHHRNPRRESGHSRHRRKRSPSPSSFSSRSSSVSSSPRRRRRGGRKEARRSHHHHHRRSPSRSSSSEGRKTPKRNQRTEEHHSSHHNRSVSASVSATAPRGTYDPTPLPESNSMMINRTFGTPYPGSRSVHAPARRMSGGSSAHHESRVEGNVFVGGQRNAQTGGAPQHSAYDGVGVEAQVLEDMPIKRVTSMNSTSYDASSVDVEGDDGGRHRRASDREDTDSRGRQVGPGGRRGHSAPAPRHRSRSETKKKDGSGWQVHGKPDPLPGPSQRNAHYPQEAAGAWQLRSQEASVERAGSYTATTGTTTAPYTTTAYTSTSGTPTHTPAVQSERPRRRSLPDEPRRAPGAAVEVRAGPRGGGGGGGGGGGDTTSAFDALADRDGWVEKGSNPSAADFYDSKLTLGPAVKTSFPPPTHQPIGHPSVKSSKSPTQSYKAPPKSPGMQYVKSPPSGGLSVGPRSLPSQPLESGAQTSQQGPPPSAASQRAEASNHPTVVPPGSFVGGGGGGDSSSMVPLASPKMPPPEGSQRTSLAERRSQRLSTNDNNNANPALKQKWDALHNSRGHAVDNNNNNNSPEQTTSAFSEKGKRQSAHDLRREVWKAETEKKRAGGGGSGGGGGGGGGGGDEAVIVLSTAGERLGITVEHAVLATVKEGFAADRAGLTEFIGRKVTHINGTKTNTLREIQAACEDKTTLCFRFASTEN